jgi:hypothetical protein
MERNAVSIHEVRVFQCFTAAPSQWFTAAQVAEVAGVAARTARAHALKLVQLGILDQLAVFPAHRYKLAVKADKRNKGYYQRLIQAAEIFSLEGRHRI